MDRCLSIIFEREVPMSDTPAVYGQFGQALGLAERTLSTILRQHLAQRDTIPEAWYASACSPPADRAIPGKT
jgi:hypothetical protein